MQHFKYLPEIWSAIFDTPFMRWKSKVKESIIAERADLERVWIEHCKFKTEKSPLWKRYNQKDKKKNITKY